jgi:beta-galactosidase
MDVGAQAPPAATAIQDRGSPSDAVSFLLRGSGQSLDAFSWRGTTWLTEAVRDSALGEIRLLDLGEARLARTRADVAGFSRTRTVFHRDRGYTVVFDSAQAGASGSYTVGAAWRTAQQPRLRTGDTLLLDDRSENRLSLRWFASQPVEAETERSPAGGAAGEVLNLRQSATREFRKGERWNLTNVMLPHRQLSYAVRNLAPAGETSFSAIEVERPEGVEVAGVASEAGRHAFGRVATDAEAVLVSWTRKFGGPVRAWYAGGAGLQIETGLRPSSVTIRRFDGRQEAPPFGPAQWSFTGGRVDVKLIGSAGQIEARFADPARASLNLNSDWRMLPSEAAGAAEPSFDDSAWRSVELPYSQLVRGTPPNLHWYRRRFTLPASARRKQVFLDFEGVAIQCAVWVNGKPAGEHLGAFDSFSFDITPLLKPAGEENVFAVRVDYSADWRSKIPFLPEGYNDYGGIYRDVWLRWTDPLHVESVFVTTPEITVEQSSVRVQAEVANKSGARRSAALTSVVRDAGGREVARASTPFEIQPGATLRLTQDAIRVAKPRLWSPEAPYLYTVTTEVVEAGAAIDEVRNPLGFRWYRFDPEQGFFLNGRSLKLHGVNMHQGYPYVGNAVPNSKMPFDLHVLKAMGTNFLRTTHINMDPVVLEMADRLGIMIWEEIPVAGYGNGRMGDPFYDENAKRQMRAMVRRDRNHPSVILWATMNEAAGGESKSRLPATLALCRELHRIAKEEDPTRLTAIAETSDAYFGITDVSGRNAYYRGASLYYVAAMLDGTKRQYPQGNFLISEYGAPNVERGAFGTGRTDTEEYAALAHEHNLREHEKRAWVAGSTIWNAFDYAHGNPHEGVTDEARYPKDAYFFYQSQWSAEPMLRIRSSAHWNFGSERPASNKPAAAHDVVVDSNCDTVELFLNGRSQGVRTGPGPFVWPQLVYAPGTLRAVGRRGTALLEHTRTTAGPPRRVVLTADTYELAADGKDLAYLQARVVDAEGRLVANSYEKAQLAVEGSGELVGPAAARLLAGIATLNSVRSATRPGEIKVTARIGDLEPGEIVIRVVAGKSSVDYE